MQFNLRGDLGVRYLAIVIPVLDVPYCDSNENNVAICNPERGNTQQRFRIFKKLFDCKVIDDKGEVTQENNDIKNVTKSINKKLTAVLQNKEILIVLKSLLLSSTCNQSQDNTARELVLEGNAAHRLLGPLFSSDEIVDLFKTIDDTTVETKNCGLLLSQPIQLNTPIGTLPVQLHNQRSLFIQDSLRIRITPHLLTANTLEQQLDAIVVECFDNQYLQSSIDYFLNLLRPTRFSQPKELYLWIAKMAQGNVPVEFRVLFDLVNTFCEKITQVDFNEFNRSELALEIFGVCQQNNVNIISFLFNLEGLVEQESKELDDVFHKIWVLTYQQQKKIADDTNLDISTLITKFHQDIAELRITHKLSIRQISKIFHIALFTSEKESITTIYINNKEFLYCREDDGHILLPLNISLLKDSSDMMMISREALECVCSLLETFAGPEARIQSLELADQPLQKLMAKALDNYAQLYRSPFVNNQASVSNPMDINAFIQTWLQKPQGFFTKINEFIDFLNLQETQEAINNNTENFKLQFEKILNHKNENTSISIAVHSKPLPYYLKVVLTEEQLQRWESLFSFLKEKNTDSLTPSAAAENTEPLVSNGVAEQDQPLQEITILEELKDLIDKKDYKHAINIWKKEKDNAEATDLIFNTAKKNLDFATKIIKDSSLVKRFDTHLNKTKKELEAVKWGWIVLALMNHQEKIAAELMLKFFKNSPSKMWKQEALATYINARFLTLLLENGIKNSQEDINFYIEHINSKDVTYAQTLFHHLDNEKISLNCQQLDKVLNGNPSDKDLLPLIQRCKWNTLPCSSQTMAEKCLQCAINEENYAIAIQILNHSVDVLNIEIVQVLCSKFRAPSHRNFAENIYNTMKKQIKHDQVCAESVFAALLATGSVQALSCRKYIHSQQDKNTLRRLLSICPSIATYNVTFHLLFQELKVYGMTKEEATGYLTAALKTNNNAVIEEIVALQLPLPLKIINTLIQGKLLQADGDDLARMIITSLNEYKNQNIPAKLLDYLKENNTLSFITLDVLKEFYSGVR